MQWDLKYISRWLIKDVILGCPSTCDIMISSPRGSLWACKRQLFSPRTTSTICYTWAGQDFLLQQIKYLDLKSITHCSKIFSVFSLSDLLNSSSLTIIPQIEPLSVSPWSILEELLWQKAKSDLPQTQTEQAVSSQETVRIHEVSSHDGAYFSHSQWTSHHCLCGPGCDQRQTN